MKYGLIIPLGIGLAAMAAVACAGGKSAVTESTSGAQETPVAEHSVPDTGSAASTVPIDTGSEAVTEAKVEDTPAPEPTNTPVPEPADAPAPGPTEVVKVADELDDLPPGYLTFRWNTDFSKHSVPWNEITPGGPPPDGIPPIDDPRFVAVADAPDYMFDLEQVISLEANGEAKAYPLAILMWHEIVNDEVGGLPVTITYCPLCNTAIAFEGTLDGRVLDFGTTGNVRNSDLVMWDRQTESWWQQITGEAIVGDLTGTKLVMVPVNMIAWSDFVAAFPDGQVLSRETGAARPYDLTPYGSYDSPANYPFLYGGKPDRRLGVMERIVGLSMGDESVAYPFSLLEEHRVVHDQVGGQDIVVFFGGESVSAFSQRDATDPVLLGSTGVYKPFADGTRLTFAAEDGGIVDEQTGSTWNVLGKAVEGPLQGEQLAPIVHANHFWFAWAAFNPHTTVRVSEDLEDDQPLAG